MNVFSLFENAVLAWKDRPAVRYGDRRQTYGELADSASAFAGSLASWAWSEATGSRSS
jgi:hypothetical protein